MLPRTITAPQRHSAHFFSLLVSRDTIATTSPLHERLKLSQRCFLLRQNRLGSGFCKHELSNRTPGLRHLVLMISRQPLIKIQFPLGQSQLIQVSSSDCARSRPSPRSEATPCRKSASA